MTTDELRRIHEAGLHVLGSTGVVFESEDIVRRFRAAGFGTDGERVLMSEDQVAAALSSAPRSFELVARGDGRSLVFGRGRTVVASASGPTFVAEGGELRPPDLDDVAKYARLCHRLENVDMVGYGLYFPDMDDPAEYRRSVYEYLTLTDKPFEYPAFTEMQRRVFRDTSEILYGASWHERPRFLYGFTSMSPLRFDGDTCRAVEEMALLGQPLWVMAIPIGGVSGPVTAGGLLVLQHAEALAGVVLAQLLSPGCPIIYGGVASAGSMRTGGMLAGDPTFWGLAAATVELGHWLDLPVRAGGAITDAHLPDLQAGIESALGVALVLEREVDFLFQGMGVLSAYNALSWEKLVVDDELIGALRSRPWQIDLSPESLALDVIEKVGPGGMYLSQRHTRTHRQGGAKPSVFTRQSYDSTLGAGADTVLTAAADRVAELLETYEQPPLDEVTRRQLAAYCSV
jgi:trimethylamine---corrinoid protein Co-methyltransferase